MIFDDLHPGEEIGMIDTNRPNPNLLAYRQGQLRAVGAGTTTSYSSVAKDYNGTYSARSGRNSSNHGRPTRRSRRVHVAHGAAGL
jgi:capsid protein